MPHPGVVKIMTQDPVWRNGTALSYHYWTQPLPTWLAFYCHHLVPATCHTFSVYLHFFLELAVPFAGFFHELHTIGVVGLVILQIGILATGNYGFFNYLSLVLAVSLLPDHIWPETVTRTVLEFIKATSANRPIGSYGIEQQEELFSAIALVLLNLMALCFALAILNFSLRPFARLGKGKLNLPGWWSNKCDSNYLRAIHVANYYGLFGHMTTYRDEVIIEGSNDLRDWKEYEFLYKPSGSLERRPSFVFPGHLPRLVRLQPLWS